MSTLRRSTRITKPVVYEQGPSYPDGRPANNFEHTIARLNLETFPCVDFAHVDDILLRAFFGTKRRHQSYRALTPSTAFVGQNVHAKDDELLSISHIFTHATSQSYGESHDAAIIALTQSIISAHPNLFSPSHIPIVAHLVARYYLFLSPQSPVKIQKVSFCHEIGIGLMARQPIPAATFILSACASASSDYSGLRQGVSIISSSSSDPFANRLVLGPFRFANHDCNPNSQMYLIPSTNAYTIVTLRDIQEGEQVTISYDGGDRSYFKDSSCLCATCKPDNPPVPERREVDHNLFLPNPGTKKTRRSGQKHRKRRGEAIVEEQVE